MFNNPRPDGVARPDNSERTFGASRQHENNAVTFQQNDPQHLCFNGRLSFSISRHCDKHFRESPPEIYIGSSRSRKCNRACSLKPPEF